LADKKHVLTKHHLSHLPNLVVGENIIHDRFQGDCSMANCNASCCKHGVFLDVGERENILAHAEIIQRHLEPHQEHDPQHWFEEREFDDADFPSGRATGTQARDYGCVFLDSKGYCALQKTAMAEGMEKFALKPFFCVAFPIAIEHGTLIIDDVNVVNRPECCRSTLLADLSVFDICAEELEFVLGKEGVKELSSVVGGRRV
jgi:hypothetical protein